MKNDLGRVRETRPKAASPARWIGFLFVLLVAAGTTVYYGGGGGGGAFGNTAIAAGAGGSGVVIVRYALSGDPPTVISFR